MDWDLGVAQSRGSLFGCPYDKDSSISGVYIGVPKFLETTILSVGFKGFSVPGGLCPSRGLSSYSRRTSKEEVRYSGQC